MTLGDHHRVSAAVRLMLIGALLLTVSGCALLGGSEDRMERFTHLHGLAIAPWAPDQVFLATHYGLLVLDQDGTWRAVSEEEHDLMGFAVNSMEEGVLFSSGHPAAGSDIENPVGFMVSRDAGVTWSVLALEGQVDFHAMAAAPGDPNIIYGWNVYQTPGFYRSESGGEDWDPIPTPELDDTLVLALAVDPLRPVQVLAATGLGLFRSQNGGSTWVPILTGGRVTSVAFSPHQEGVLKAYAPQSEAGLLISDNGGATWVTTGFMLENGQIDHIAFHPEEPDIIYLGSHAGSLFRTTDGGETWQQLADQGLILDP